MKKSIIFWLIIIIFMILRPNVSYSQDCYFIDLAFTDTCSDPLILTCLWHDSILTQAERKVIEVKLSQVINTVDDFGTLLLCWQNSNFNSFPEEIIEERMLRVLPKITNLDRLIYYWQGIYPGYPPRNLIINQIKAVLKSGHHNVSCEIPRELEPLFTVD